MRSLLQEKGRLENKIELFNAVKDCPKSNRYFLLLEKTFISNLEIEILKKKFKKT